MPKPNVRNKLLTAGLETMHRLGFNGCSVQDITQAADVPKGSFYNHFESKEALGAEILDLYWQKAAVSLQILNDEALPPIERLKRYFDALAELTSLSYERGCLLGNFSAELSDQSSLVRERLSSLLASWTHSLARCVRDAQIAGEIRADLDASDLAAFFVNTWEGAVLRAKVDRDGRSLAQFSTVMFSAILT
jgi:TetR/AcrR family transcriptional regulator, transcriptional repressor for nem operon